MAGGRRDKDDRIQNTWPLCRSLSAPLCSHRYNVPDLLPLKSLQLHKCGNFRFRNVLLVHVQDMVKNKYVNTLFRNCEGGVPSCEDASIPSQVSFQKKFYLATLLDSQAPVLWIWIRIRIGSRFNGVPGSGSRRAKMTHKHRKKLINFIFLSAGSLDVLFCGLKT